MMKDTHIWKSDAGNNKPYLRWRWWWWRLSSVFSIADDDDYDKNHDQNDSSYRAEDSDKDGC